MKYAFIAAGTLFLISVLAATLASKGEECQRWQTTLIAGMPHQVCVDTHPDSERK